jgi:hypothetical protein
LPLAGKFSRPRSGITFNDEVFLMQTVNSLMARAALPEVLPTDEAAAAINRKPQTLRKWACLENGPIRPVRINGRLAWRVSDLQTLLSGGAQ